MKNIIVIVNYDTGAHSMRFLKHHKKPVDQFHLDVRNYGINKNDKFFNNLDTDKVHMILTNNPITAFKLYTIYEDKLSICLMDEDCNYKEIENPSVENVIKLVCDFNLPHSIDSNDTDYEDFTVEDNYFPPTPIHDGWFEVNEFMKNVGSDNVLFISDLDKFNHTTELGAVAVFYNINRPESAFTLSNSVKDIKHIVIKSELYKNKAEIMEHIVKRYFDLNVDLKSHTYFVHESDETMYVHEIIDEEFKLKG